MGEGKGIFFANRRLIMTKTPSIEFLYHNDKIVALNEEEQAYISLVFEKRGVKVTSDKDETDTQRLNKLIKYIDGVK